MNKTIKYIFSSLTILLLFPGCATQAPDTTDADETATTENKITFRILSQGQTSGLAQRKFLTLRSAAEFSELWGIHTQLNPQRQPKIDFKQQMVVAVFMGEQRTGGYAIRIENIIEHEKMIQVNVVLTKPKPGSSRVMMITQPNMMVALPLSKKTVIYQFWTDK